MPLLHCNIFFHFYDPVSVSGTSLVFPIVVIIFNRHNCKKYRKIPETDHGPQCQQIFLNFGYNFLNINILNISSADTKFHCSFDAFQLGNE
jgi:hypothetical protein